MHPTWRRVLDVIFRIHPDVLPAPGLAAEAASAIEAATVEFREVMERMVRGGMTLAGYDRDLVEPLAAHAARIMDQACPGLRPGDPVYDRTVDGMILSVMVGSGGMRSYGRVLKRWGALARFARQGLGYVVPSMARDRASFYERLDGGSLDVDAARSPGPLRPPIRLSLALRPVEPPPAVPTLDGGVEAPSLVISNVEIASVWTTERLFLGTDVAQAVGYGNPRRSLNVFLAKEDASVARILSHRGRDGQRRKVVFLTARGLALFLLRARRTLGGDANAKVADAILDRLLAGASPPEIERPLAVARDVVAFERTHARATAILEARLDRTASLADGLASEVAALQRRVEDLEAEAAVDRQRIASEADRARISEAGLRAEIEALKADNGAQKLLVRYWRDQCHLGIVDRASDGAQ